MFPGELFGRFEKRFLSPSAVFSRRPGKGAEIGGKRSVFYKLRLKNGPTGCKLASRSSPRFSPTGGRRSGDSEMFPPPIPRMSEKNRIRKPSKPRRLLRFVLWTVGLPLVLILIAAAVAVLTADLWIVPLGAWYAGVEVEGTPGVSLSLTNRELLLTDLKLRTQVGTFTAKSCGLRFDGMTMDAGEVRELHVSGVHAEGLRAALDFQKTAEAVDLALADGTAAVSAEFVKEASWKLWKSASKPVLRIHDLTLQDAEAEWRAGVEQTTVSVQSLSAAFEDGCLTRPRMTSRVQCRIEDSRRSIGFGFRLKANSPAGGGSVLISAEGVGPLEIDFPDSRLEFPALESTEMLVQYEPDAIRFGGEWTTSDRWEFEPLGLSLDNTMFELFGTLGLRGEKLCLKFGANAQASDPICRGEPIPGDLMLELKSDVEFDLVTGGVTFEALSGRLDGPGGRIDLGTAGVFEIVHHEDGSYSVSPNDARLTLATPRGLDLTPYDALLPFDAVDRVLSADYFLELKQGRETLAGGVNLTLTDRKTRKRVFDADAEFETDGITHVTAFDVTRCGLNFYDGDDPVCRGLLTGKYNIRSASLEGGVNYYPYRMLSAFGDRELADLCGFLDDANLCEAEHSAEAALEFDLVNMTAKLRKVSHLSHLALTGAGGTDLQLDAVGSADFRFVRDLQGWLLDSELELTGGDEFHAVLNASAGSDSPVTGDFRIDRISDSLARQLERKFFPDRELPVLRFANASASSSFRFDPEENRIGLTNILAELDNGSGRVSFRSAGGLSWREGQLSRDPVEFNVRMLELPASFWDPLLADVDDFGLSGGVVTAEFDVRVPEDGTALSGEGMLVGTDMTLLLNGYPRELARLGTNFAFHYDLEKSFLILPQLNIDVQDRKARQTLFASGAGTVDVSAENRVRMRFPEVRLGPEALYLIGYGVQRSFYFEELDAAGEIEFRADHDFAEMSWDGELKINRMQLQSDDPEEYTFPVLSGRLDGELLWADDELFGDASIVLRDDTGEDHLSGRYIYLRGSGLPPKFITSSLDLPFAVSYSRFNHNTDPGMETPPFLLPDKVFDLSLHGVYSRSHALIFSVSGPLELKGGDEQLILAPRMVFSGDVLGTASVAVRIQDGPWPFEAAGDLENIPFDKSFTAFLATDGNPEIPHGLHGIVNRLHATVKGEGFTSEALVRNLRADCKAEVENVSLISSLRDRSLFVNILLMPLLSVPRIIDLVPGEMLRRLLRLVTAGSLMDMISGETPIEFKHGTADLSVRQGVVELRELELEGDPLERYQAHGTIDLAGDGGADLETTTRFALFYWPVYLNGDLFDPKVSYGKSIAHFFSDNAKYLLVLFPDMIISAFTSEDADEIDRLEEESEKKSSEPDSETDSGTPRP